MAIEMSKQHINTMVRKLRYCPVTGNIPTEMTQEAFDTACEAARVKERGKGYCRSKRKVVETWCDTCQGRRTPKGLTILTPKLAMAKRLAEQRRRAA